MTLNEQIEKAKRDFSYYLRKREKYLDNPKKFSYYNDRLIMKEEILVKLLNKQRKGK
jgi:hypothetical protein